MSRIVYDALLGRILLHDHPFRNVSSDPATGKTGQIILNTTDHKIKVYYDDSWQTLHTLTSGEESYNILLESGDALLLENGDNILLESGATVTSGMLLESGDAILLENGDKLLLEG